MKLERVNCNNGCRGKITPNFWAVLHTITFMSLDFVTALLTIVDVSPYVSCSRASFSRYVLVSVPVFEFYRVDPVSFSADHTIDVPVPPRPSFHQYLLGKLPYMVVPI
jgi:hypothetical protein